MGRYGNIEGISTLTGNTIAKDNVRGSIGKILNNREKEIAEQKYMKAYNKK